jgi:hypothetical protein
LPLPGKRRGCHPAASRKAKAVQYLGFTDLLARWIYTRQGLYKVMARDGFPAPVFTINRGRTQVWHEADICRYERAHPELNSEAAKQHKIRGCAAAALKRADSAALNTSGPTL